MHETVHYEKTPKLRTKAKMILRRMFIKKMNNAVFGKIMENVRNHVDIKGMRTSDEGKNQYIATQTFVRS